MIYINGRTFELWEPGQSKDDCFAIDAAIVPAVQVLNRKGYYKSDCCAGHPFNTEGNGMYYSYVKFRDGVEIPSAPPGFELRDGAVMRFWDLSVEFFEFLRDNADSMEKLYKWALGLPEVIR